MSESHKDLFTGLVMMMSQSALLHMGKLVNPATGKAEVKLEYAQEAIDTLDMLEAKTRGNLATDEAKMIRETIAYLKINYLETSRSQPASSKPADATPAVDQGANAKDGGSAPG